MISQSNDFPTASRMGYQRDLESSVHMRLYTLTKKQFILLSILFSLVLIVSCLTSLYAPTVLTRTTHYGSGLVASENLPNGPFLIHSQPVLLYQKEIWLSAAIHRESTTAKISIPIGTSVSITCFAQPVLEDEPVAEKETSQHETSLWTHTYFSNSTLNCVSKTCDEILIAHLAVLTCDVYAFEVKFNNPLSGTDDSDEKTNFPKVNEVEFILQTYNSTFTYFELFCRFIAFLGVFCLLTVFILSMRPFQRKNWTIEQFWTSVLLFLLLLFCNPFHPMVFLMKGIFPQVADYFFQITFISALLFYWLSVYHGFRITNRGFCKFYLFKVTLVGSIWMLYFTCTVYHLQASYQDPVFDLFVPSQRIFFYVFASFLGILTFVYLLYFFILLIRTYSELRGLAYFDIRLRFLTIPGAVVAIGGFVAWISRFDLSFPPSYRPVTTEFVGAFKEGDFFSPSHIPQPMFRSSFELVFIFALLFAYMFINILAYGPAKTALVEANFKDDPAVSMFYDSDEDVLYGSDTEDLHMRSLRHH